MNPTTSAGALQQLNQFQANAKTPDQAFNEANQQFGVPGAQQTLTGLRGAIQQTTNVLNNVAPSVMGRTGNSLVTSAQANRIIGNEQAPIQTNLTKLGTDYGNAQQDFQNAEQQAQAKAGATISGQNGQLSYLQQLYQSLADQEQKQAALAEQQREFNLTPHGSGGGGLGDLGSLLGGATGSSKAQAGGTDPNAFIGLIQELRQQPGGVGKWSWGTLANEFKNRGIDVSHGSPADVALNSYFNAGGNNAIGKAGNPLGGMIGQAYQHSYLPSVFKSLGNVF